MRAKQGGAKQKTFSYEKLANIYFKNLDYVTASAYYDSILNVAENKQTLRIKRIERRSKNLTSLTKNEKLLQRNDSILLLASMPKEALEEYFQEYINKIKKEDEALAQKKLNALSFGSSFGGSSLSIDTAGKWYFYNTQSLGFGKGEFKRVWGNRPLEDNWRISDKSIISSDVVAKEASFATTSEEIIDLSDILQLSSKGLLPQTLLNSPFPKPNDCVL